MPFALGKKRVTAYADHHRKRHDEKANREAERNACNAQTSNALADKETVYNIVEGVHAHADDGGNGKLQDKLRDACCAKRIKAFGVKFTHRAQS